VGDLNAICERVITDAVWQLLTNSEAVSPFKTDLSARGKDPPNGGDDLIRRLALEGCSAPWWSR